MIRDDKAFIALLEKSRQLELDVTLLTARRMRPWCTKSAASIRRSGSRWTSCARASLARTKLGGASHNYGSDSWAPGGMNHVRRCVLRH